MLWVFPYDDTHELAELHTELEYFFDKLRHTSAGTAFSVSGFFSSSFSLKLSQTRKKKLLNLFENFYTEFLKLPSPDQSELLDCFVASNQIDQLLDGDNIGMDLEKLKLEQFPTALVAAIKQLFVYMYEQTLKPARKRHYQTLISRISSYCPFCGIELLTTDKKKTQDYDHILNKATYPFAAINPRNLVPMGSICNQKYKLKVNVLLDSSGNRRKYANPYVHKIPIVVDFKGTALPSASNRNGIWKIDFITTPVYEPYITTWCEVFEIKDRYEAFIVKDHYETWRKQFVQARRGKIRDIDDLKNHFARVAKVYERDFYVDKNFLRHALFSYWAECDDTVFYKSILRELRA